MAFVRLAVPIMLLSSLGGFGPELSRLTDIIGPRAVPAVGQTAFWPETNVQLGVGHVAAASATDDVGSPSLGQPSVDQDRPVPTPLATLPWSANMATAKEQADVVTGTNLLDRLYPPGG